MSNDRKGKLLPENIGYNILKYFNFLLNLIVNIINFPSSGEWVVLLDNLCLTSRNTVTPNRKLPVCMLLQTLNFFCLLNFVPIQNIDYVNSISQCKFQLTVLFSDTFFFFCYDTPLYVKVICKQGMLQLTK